MSHTENHANTVELMASLRYQAATGSYALADDRDYFAHTQISDSAIRLRVLVERAVVRRAVFDLLAIKSEEGQYQISVSDGDETVLRRSTKVSEIMAAIMSTGEEFMTVRIADGESERTVGTILLIYGNDGPDVLADHACTLESALARAYDFADEIATLM